MVSNMRRYHICIKGEHYFEIDAESRDEAIDEAFDALRESPGYFKSRDTDVWEEELDGDTDSRG